MCTLQIQVYLTHVFCVSVDGPVTVGMSLDIASIDTISEINMVRQHFLYPTVWCQIYCEKPFIKPSKCIHSLFPQ